MAEQMTKTFADEIQSNPEAFTFFLSAMYMINQSDSIVVVGDQKDPDVIQMLEALKPRHLLNTVIQQRQPDETYKLLENKATTYICRGKTCFPPVNSLDSMLKKLGTK
jgi:uncharacterized protein